MIIGINSDYTGKESYSTKFKEYLNNKGIEVKELDLLKNDAISQARFCDGIMWRWLHRPADKQSAKKILYVIEKYLKIPVFPNAATSWHYDNKIAQKYFLDTLHAPFIDTKVFWDYNEALSWADDAEYPVIFKLSAGAGSSNVLKINSREEAVDFIYKMFRVGIFSYTMNEFKKNDYLSHFKKKIKESVKFLLNNEFPSLHRTWWKPEFGYIYLQKFLPNNSFDTRVTTIGNRAFGYRRFNRKNDFRASGSGNFDTDPGKIDLKCVEIAFKVSKKAGFQSMAYDFLYDQDGNPLIGEISYTFVDWMVHACPGFWDENLDWNEGNIWPEYAIAEDFISTIKV